MNLTARILIVVMLVLASTVGVVAVVGQTRTCINTVPGQTLNAIGGGGSTTVEFAQTFRPTESFELHAVKPNLRAVGNNSGSVNVSVRHTTAVSGTPRPNATIVATVVLPITPLPLYVTPQTSDLNRGKCNPLINQSQVFELATPVTVNAGQTYAVVVQRNDLTNQGSDTYNWMRHSTLATPPVNIYTPGMAWSNGASFNENVPSDWSTSGFDTYDFEMAIYDGSILSPPAGIEPIYLGWISFLGLPTLLLIMGIAATVILVRFGAPIYMVLVMGFLLMLLLERLGVLEGWIVLMTFVLFGAAMILRLIIRSQSGESD